MTDQEWLEEFTKPDEIPETTVAWLRSLSPASQETARTFPPECVVKAKPEFDLHCPRLGRYGTVVTISRDGTQVKIRPSPNDTQARYTGMCDLDWLEIVGYWRGLTPEKVSAILDAAQN